METTRNLSKVVHKIYNTFGHRFIGAFIVTLHFLLCFGCKSLSESSLRKLDEPIYDLAITKEMANNLLFKDYLVGVFSVGGYKVFLDKDSKFIVKNNLSGEKLPAYVSEVIMRTLIHFSDYNMNRRLYSCYIDHKYNFKDAISSVLVNYPLAYRKENDKLYFWFEQTIIVERITPCEGWKWEGESISYVNRPQFAAPSLYESRVMFEDKSSNSLYVVGDIDNHSQLLELYKRECDRIGKSQMLKSEPNK